MPRRILCPLCHRVLIAADLVAGETKQCPVCGGVFQVPAFMAPPPAQPPPAAAAIPRCPGCGQEVGPTATICRRCHRDLRTGRRLPWRRRLRLFTWRFWAVAGLGLAVGGIVLIAAVQFWLIRARTTDVTFVPTTQRAVPVDDLARALLMAGNTEARQAALDELRGVEAQAAPAVAEQLAASLERVDGAPALGANQRAAIDLLARHGPTHPDAKPSWCELLTRCQQVRGLRDAALRARALLGDAGALDELAQLWLSRLDHLLLLKRVAGATQSENQPAMALLLRRSTEETARAADGLRALARDDAVPVFERVVSAYWGSWQWLGQDAGERLAEGVFDLGRPPGARLEFRPEDVRRPRDALRDVARRAAPATRAAAGLILLQRGPQYRTLCHAIADTLAALLPGVEPADQQRLTWTIGLLRGRLFGPEPRRHPADVTPDEIAAALRWAHPDQPARATGPLPQPPLLRYRAVTAGRRLEQDLLADLTGSWPSAATALDRWLRAGLGCTPRIEALLNPAQRTPSYPGLAAALVIVAATDAWTLQPQLELWHEATEQPAWVRALAYTVLGSFDARRGRWDSGWPAGLDLGDVAPLEREEPGWRHFGRVLAAGGPPMLSRLRDFEPAPLPGRIRDRLLQAAVDAARSPTDP